MALYVDFVGLNTLVEEPVDVNTNTVGNFSESRASGSTLLNAGRGDGAGTLAPFAGYPLFPDGELRNTSIQTINGADYLVALNLHRNGPYGYPIFKQLRAGQSPIIRQQRLTNIFSHYEYPGETLTFEDGRNSRNFTLVRFTKLPPVNSSLAITFEGESPATKTIRFTNTGVLESTFTANELNIKLDDSSLTTLRSDHDRAKAIADRIARAVKALNISSLRRVLVSTSRFLYSQASLFIETRAFGADGKKITSVAVAQPNTKISNQLGTLETVSRVVPQRRGPVQHYNEVPVVSRHKPLRMIGSVTTTDETSNKDSLERVEVYTTLGNETTHFSNARLNKFYGTEGLISEDYENFVDLYLEGGVDGDESPIDEFRLLSYRQVVYPKEIYTYKDHTRNRINFISRYWRDLRTNRTELDVNNGFGFSVPSQSAWVLDAEQNFKDLTFQITPGVLTMHHPNRLLNKISFASGTIDSTGFHAGKNGADDGGAYSSMLPSASTHTFTFPDSGTGVNERAISLVDLGDKRISYITPRHYSPIAGHGGYPNTNVPVYTAGPASGKQAVAINPWDLGVEALHRYTVAETVNVNAFTSGLRKAFEKRGFKLGSSDDDPSTAPELTQRSCRGSRRDLDTSEGMQIMTAGVSPSAAHRAEWRLKTTSSTISTWLLPTPNNMPGNSNSALSSDTILQTLFLSGTLYHESVTVTPIHGGAAETKLSKVINFDPEGGVEVRLGTVFSASNNQAATEGQARLIYVGADEPGAVVYKTADPYGVDNPIYKSAMSWNEALVDNATDRRKAKFIAATNVNHFLAELNLSGSEPQLGLASTWSNNNTSSYLANRGELFQQKHAHNNTNTGGGSPTPLNVKRDPNGYAKIYINASCSATTTRLDPYKFLSGSQSRLDGSFQEQLTNSNSSIKLGNISSNRNQYNLSNPNFTSIGPFNSQGFSFSYWIQWGEDPEGYAERDNLIFSIQDKDGNAIIDHSIGGSGKYLSVNFKNSDGTTRKWEGLRSAGYVANAWYNITFTLRNNSGTMEGNVKAYRKNWKSETTAWTSKTWNGSAMTYAEFAKIKDSKKLYVLPAGSGFTALRDAGQAGTTLDNVNLDNLVFWNGGLTDYLMETVLSGASGPGPDGTTGAGYAGDAPAPIEAALYPATDTSIAVESLSAPTFAHAQRLHEMNTLRASYDGAVRGRNTQRGDRYYPLGNGFTPKNFQDDVLDSTVNGGVAGQMDYAFWFKASHQNYRNRSIRYHQAESDASNPITFNSNLGNRSEHYKGFLVSFWMRRNGNYSTTNHTNIMSGENERWGICVTRDNSHVLGASNQRKLALWFNADDSFTGHSYLDVRQSVFVSATQMPEDDEWHHCTVQWNGKTGLEMAVAFTIDNGSVEYAYEPAVYDNTYSPPGQGDNPLMTLAPLGAGSTKIESRNAVDEPFRNGVNIINPAPSLNLHGSTLVSHNMNIAQIVAFESPLEPHAGGELRSQLYNEGQFIDAKTDSAILTILENSSTTYASGYPAHDYNNGHAKIINGTPSGGNLSSYVNGLARSYNYNYSHSQMFYARHDTNVREPYFEIEKPNNGTWAAPGYSRGGGWTVSFIFKIHSDNIETFRESNSNITLIRLTDDSGDRVVSLFKPAGETDDLWGYCGWSDGTVGKYVFPNAQVYLFDGAAHQLLFTTSMQCDAAGVPANANLFIDETQMSSAYYTSSPAAAAQKTIASSNPVAKINLFGNHNGGNRCPASFYFANVKVFRQYFGGGGGTIALRKQMVATAWSGDSATYGASQAPRTRIKDFSWYLPDYTIGQGNSQTINFENPGSGLLSAASVKYLPAIVDCPLAGWWSGDVVETDNNTLDTFNVKNLATKSPTLMHYYKLGTEPELAGVALFDRLKKPVLPNYAISSAPSATPGTDLSGSNLAIMDSGPRHWNVDWFSNTTGDVSSTGTEQERSRTGQRNQRLFFIGDHRDDSHPRDAWQGIELYLSASGGGYRLVSAIGRTTDEIKQSAENLIIPDRWYYVYGKYTNCKAGSTPSSRIYLNGKDVTFTDVQAGAGNFDVLTDNGSDYALTIGGTKNDKRHGFSGFMQDFAMWNKNATTDTNTDSVPDAAAAGRNVWDGIRDGSSYIDTTAGNNLMVASRMGFKQGGSVSKLNKVAGTLSVNGVTANAFDNSSRAFVTGPPIEWFRSTVGGQVNNNGGTVISFWLSMDNADEKGIIGFNSDVKFPTSFYDSYADNGVSFKNKLFNYTDSSAMAAQDDSTLRRARISISKSTSGAGNYTLFFRTAGIYDNNNTSHADRGRSDWLNLFSKSIVSSFTDQQIPTLGTMFHNTIILTSDKIRWYVNGEFVGEESFSMQFSNQDTMLQHPYPRGGETTEKYFINGWNNISLLDENDPFSVRSKIDEAAVLFYPNMQGFSAPAKLELAQSLHNGGMVYDFTGRKESLYAWWRMGENVLTTSPLPTDGTVISAGQQIDDESGRPAYARNHLGALRSGQAKGVQRTGASATDLRNHYKFTATEIDNATIPYGKFSAGAVNDSAASSGMLCTINGTNQKLSINGGSLANWEYDYSFDSYKLYPFGWLATEGVPEEVYIQGKHLTNGQGTARIRYGPHDTKPVTSRLAIADFAIFTGTSNNYSAQGNGGGGAGTGTYDTTSQTKAVTRISFGGTTAASMPSAGDVLVLISNPRKIAGGGQAQDGSSRELRILFKSSGGTGTAFGDPSGFGSRPDARQLDIDISATTTPEAVIDAIQTAIAADSTHGLGTTYWSYSQPNVYTLVITSVNPGGDGKYEIVGKYEGQGQDNLRCKITTVVGASHISKALSRKPGHGWVQMNDSDFSRGTYANTFVFDTTKSGSRGLLPTPSGSGGVKPYWYALETKNDGVAVGAYETNTGLSAHTSQFNIKNTVISVDNYANYTPYHNIDSGSTVVMTLNNTPQLDFNDIRMHTGSYFTSNISSSTVDLATPRSPLALIGGGTGANSKFGPGVLQNSYNQFAQEIEQGPTKFIDDQLSAAACYFRRHSLTGSKSFVAPFGGFLEKLSASHDDSNISTHLLGDMSASHLFLGSAKWEAGDYAGYFNDAGTFKFKSKKPFFDNYGAFIEEARPLMKDYGVVPEFRISDHVNSYLSKGATQQKLDFLHLTGALASADTSNKKDFFEIYSTTDFLKHFELVQEDHSDFVDPFAIRLRCSVVKKFLPYEGFYPAQRTVQVAQQFYKSYGDNISVTASLDDPDWNGIPNPRNPDTKRYDLSAKNKYGVQYLLNPLFSPGIMFNTIKSGVAVDYPLVTDTGSVKRITYLDPGGVPVKGGAMITQQFDTRIPFEALLEPEKHLANVTLASNEPDENSKTDIEVEWGGQGDQLYNLMVSNFLAETSEFFLENKSFTSLSSLPQGDPNFGNAKAGNVYMMRLKMFRTTTGQKSVQRNRLSKSYGVPQDQGTAREGFTMYSRPSAFGPPQFLSGSGITANTWSDFKFDGTSGSLFVPNIKSAVFDLQRLPFQHDFSYVTSSTYGYEAGGGFGAIGNEAHLGYNYPFTPPYYHGEAWADITFIPTESKKYTLQEIINQSSTEFYRYFAGAGTLKTDGFTPVTHNETDELERVGDIMHDIRTAGHPISTLSDVHDRTVAINDQAMQIASSVNIFSQGVLEQDITTQTATGIRSTTNVQVDTDLSNKYRWIIQTKFETPMLNFNSYTYGKHTTGDTNANGLQRKPPFNGSAPNLPNYTDNTYGIELPGVGPMQTPIGMWHQYGHLPQATNEGVFLQVDDVPQSWIRNAMHRPTRIARRYRSLASLCGFSTDPVRMGEVAGVKEISEAVVAIPFFEKEGRRRFLTMNRQQVKMALDPARKNLVGRTVVDMVEKMQKFVMPPSLDFVSNNKIKPFSMYIFEFNHNLTREDLSDIWQNLPPELHQTVETDEAAISHQLLAYELLGKGGRYRRGRNSEVELVRNERADSVNPEIQWMVFKVKQRAKTNYFEKIFARNESQQIMSQRLKLGVSADTLGRKNKVSYNWPYDFFSMIEGVKLNAEVHFLDYDEEASQAQEKPVIKPKTKDATKNRQKRTGPARRLLGAVSGKVPASKLKKAPEEADKKPKRKKGKITRKRRVKTIVKKPNTQKKKLNNAFDRKKLK